MIWKLSHLLVTLFLYTFATMMIVPAITDVTMSALCPGQDECSLAIYFTGFQQVVSFSYDATRLTVLTITVFVFSEGDDI